MIRTAEQLRADVQRIWWAGVREVLPERLLPQWVVVDGDYLVVGEEAVDLRSVGRIVVVGAGKASAGMAVALEQVLGERLLREKAVTGWVNVPAGSLLPTHAIHLHAARPAGINEPRAEGVAGAEKILKLVSELKPQDLCFCLISGGGSALMPAPAPGLALEDKVRIARLLAGAGANIVQLNIVRSQLSRIKGGGLARACRAGRLFSLIISDVLGDPLDLIASGPTVESAATPKMALQVLAELSLLEHPELATVAQFLRRKVDARGGGLPARWSRNLIIANNATAVDAAGCEAERLGYSHAMMAAVAPEGPAEDIGLHIARMAIQMRHERGPDCLITGGEPTVTLVPAAERGKGGRNQQLALAALTALDAADDVAILSGGTDGEDGPTDAAGAIVDVDVVQRARQLHLDPQDYLRRNDAYRFFEASGGLLKTGPTHTNVCDLRVAVVNQTSGEQP